jgi:hypothetical protein
VWLSPLARDALTTNIVASLVGALVLCFLIFRYGFGPSEDETVTEATRRQVVTRVGHAVAGVCFAIAAILAAVTLSVSVPGPQGPPPGEPGPTALQDQLTALGMRVSGLESLLGEINSSVEKVLSRLDRVEHSQEIRRRSEPSTRGTNPAPTTP